MPQVRAYQEPPAFDEVVVQTNEGPKIIRVDKRRRGDYESPRSWVRQQSPAYSNPTISAAGVTDSPMSAFGGPGEVIPVSPPADWRPATRGEWYDKRRVSPAEPVPVGSRIPAVVQGQYPSDFGQPDRGPPNLPSTVLGGSGYDRQQRNMPARQPVDQLEAFGGTGDPERKNMTGGGAARLLGLNSESVMQGLGRGFRATGPGQATTAVLKGLEATGVFDRDDEESSGSAQDASLESPTGVFLSKGFGAMVASLPPEHAKTLAEGSTDVPRVQAALDAADGIAKDMVANPTKALEDQGVDIKATVDDLVQQYKGSATDTDKLLKMDKDEQAEFLVEMGLNMMAIGGRPGSGAMGILGVMGEAGRISLEQRRRNRTKAEIENREALKLEAQVAMKREEQAARDRRDAAKQENDNLQADLDRRNRRYTATAGRALPSEVVIEQTQRQLAERENMARPESERLSTVELDRVAHQRTLAILGRSATGGSASSDRKAIDSVIKQAEKLKEADSAADLDAPLDPYIAAAVAQRERALTELSGPNALPGSIQPAGLQPAPGSREDIVLLMQKMDRKEPLSPDEVARVNAFRDSR